MKYYCTNCGAEFLKWEGKCSSCGQWDTLAEIVNESSESVKKSNIKSYVLNSEFSKFDNVRILSGFSEFDRVLGGGIVNGSVVLLSGEPGVGKSTILLQIVMNLAKDKKVLYIAGEESISQLYSRVFRLNNNSEYSNSNLRVVEEINVELLETLIREEKPEIVIVDSIQSLQSDRVKSFAGSIGQVRVAGSIITKLAKELGIATFIVGQINKDGNIAGPKVLEHIVDVVLNLEGAEYNVFRLLRAVKNRFGSTNEIGIFEMQGSGFAEISNPSKVFLEDIKMGPGSAIGAILKGSRVVFVEVQALVVDRGMESGPLRRVANGIRKPRLDMLCAVMTKRGGIFLGDKDVFVNVVGGLLVDDPTLDLAVCAAIKAAVVDKILGKDIVYFGEVGLTGEVRSGWSLESVLKESKRVGYSKFVTNPYKLKKISALDVVLCPQVSKL